VATGEGSFGSARGCAGVEGALVELARAGVLGIRVAAAAAGAVVVVVVASSPSSGRVGASYAANESVGTVATSQLGLCSSVSPSSTSVALDDARGNEDDVAAPASPSSLFKPFLLSLSLWLLSSGYCESGSVSLATLI